MSTIIRLPESIKEELNGRILLFVDRPDATLDEEEPMLYKRTGLDGAPLFGVTFYGLKGGDEIDLDQQKEHIHKYYHESQKSLPDIREYYQEEKALRREKKNQTIT